MAFHPYDRELLRARLRVYFIFGTSDTAYDPAWLLEEAIHGDITAFQFREKGSGALSGSALKSLAFKLREIARDHHILFFIDDDPELALAVEADGVHIGQEDAPYADVRRLVGPEMIIGVSTTTLDEALRAQEAGADYIGVGPIYPTQTKPGKPAVGVDHIRMLRQEGVSIPIVAIGGVTAERAPEIIKQGADGVAFITAVSRSQHPRQSAYAIVQAVQGSSANDTV